MLLGSIEYKEIKDTVQKDGEDNSEEGIDAPVNLRFVKGKAEHDADGGRRKHMEERGTHEAQIARHHGLDHRIARQRREEKEGILRRREAESDGHHVDDGVYRLVVFAAAQYRHARREIFHHLLYGRPSGGDKGLRRQKPRDEFLYRDNERDRDHAREEGERDELARLRMRRVLAPPEPQPRESREEPSCHRRENGGEFRHCRHYTGHFATISVSFSLLSSSCQIASVTKGMKGWSNFREIKRISCKAAPRPLRGGAAGAPQNGFVFFHIFRPGGDRT